MTLPPFNAVVPENEKDPNYENRLFEDCGGAILQWLIEGAAQFYRQGYKITPSTAVQEATARYRRSQNWAAPFLSSEFVDTENPNVRSRPSELYNSYQAWSRTTNHTTYSQKEFSIALSEAGFSDKLVHGKRYFVGIAPVVAEPEPLEML